MTDDQIIERFSALRRWNRGEELVPHKPLLALLALGRIQRMESRLAPFVEIEKPLGDLLRSFGPARRSHHPEYPFWRLQNDHLWEVSSDGELPSRESNADPPRTALREQNARGGFLEDIDAALRRSPRLAARAAETLLEMTFPSSLHDGVLTAVGLDLRLVSVDRDPEFRRMILRAYGYRCAFCGYDGRLDDIPGVEAAHVRWHCKQGPSVLENGIALCSLHHKAFDMGALGLADDLRIVVSVRVNGGDRTESALTSLAGRPIMRPQPGHGLINPVHRQWHFENVFKSPARE